MSHEHQCPPRDDGLAACIICGGAEGDLPTQCPGRSLTAGEREEIAAGLADFKDGRWVATFPRPGPGELKLCDRITVEVVQQMGSDRLIAHAARISTQDEARSGPRREDPDGDAKLLRYLLAQRHGTPFEHGSITFRVHAPIFVFREWHRHRIGWSYNEESARYKPLAPVFWVPPPARPLVPKPGSKPARPEFVAGSADQHARTRGTLAQVYLAAYHHYHDLMAQGVAREVARACLPVGIFSSMYATCNPRSLLHFLSLRTHEPAAKFVSYPQAEIESAARQMEMLARLYWPVTLELFQELGRVAP